LARCTRARLERAIATGANAGLDDSLNEIDFGVWTGLSCPALETREDRCRYNADRSATLGPGEHLRADAQRRIVNAEK